MALRKAQLLVPAARTLLKKKKFCKARYLAKKLDITPSLGGQILAAMPEWSKYDNRSSRRTWIKEAA